MSRLSDSVREMAKYPDYIDTSDLAAAADRIDALEGALREIRDLPFAIHNTPAVMAKRALGEPVPDPHDTLTNRIVMEGPATLHLDTDGTQHARIDVRGVDLVEKIVENHISSSADDGAHNLGWIKITIEIPQNRFDLPKELS